MSRVSALVATVALGVSLTQTFQSHELTRQVDQLTPVPVATPMSSATPLPRTTPTRASRSHPKRIQTPVRPTAGGIATRRATGSLSLSVTAYCWTGNRTASGAWPALGMAAGNRWPFGTRLRVPGVGVVVITDRIGHSSDLDLYLGRDGCTARARHFGRQHLTVEVLR